MLTLQELFVSGQKLKVTVLAFLSEGISEHTSVHWCLKPSSVSHPLTLSVYFLPSGIHTQMLHLTLSNLPGPNSITSPIWQDHSVKCQDNQVYFRLRCENFKEINPKRNYLYQRGSASANRTYVDISKLGPWLPFWFLVIMTTLLFPFLIRHHCHSETLSSVLMLGRQLSDQSIWPSSLAYSA